ncbi:hypothetical protein UPYG_G00297180 [Umbra pygmaea]|uniref:Ig-like domain-containing protein n=1 Tax=Umbra pygmaea TaxID=75934 RepID=A0ABD0WSF2_UMBPY
MIPINPPGSWTKTPKQSEAIVIYTEWERHALIGSDIRLSCSFFSWRRTSDNVTFSWYYQPDGAMETIPIFHYSGGIEYHDSKGPFGGRLEFVGNPAHRDGSILLKNLDYADNGTFTCDAKNPPDIVGRPSSVRLLVFEKAPQQSEAIVIYTEWERHALIGSDIRLSCSFFSWRRTSDNVTFSWYYQPDGAGDSITIFHYIKGEAYLDNKGPFRGRLEFVGNPAHQDGSILLKNLDYADNGTFTCDAKNPPDIVGRPSSVRLLVFEKAPQQSEAIVIYTEWERHALIGSDIRLSCSFFSWRRTSDNVTFSWYYQPDGARDSITIFQYSGGMEYHDRKGQFTDRLEFVGNPARRDGSILLKNLDYGDNGTFSCDAKNPPDIVGRPSSVRLLVFEKGEYTDIELLQYVSTLI